MKKISVLILTGIFAFAVSQVSAQKLKSGDLSVLKGQKVISLQFDYSKMKVGKYDDEEQYIRDGIDARNKKKPGTGDDWAVKWRNDKAERFQPAFVEKFNDKAGDCGLEVQQNLKDSKYTMIVHTDFLEQGVETVVMGTAKLASIDLTIDIVESSDPSKVVATIQSSGNKSKSGSTTVGGVSVNKEAYDPGLRVAECYETAGKSIGKMICKSLK